MTDKRQTQTSQSHETSQSVPAGNSAPEAVNANNSQNGAEEVRYQPLPREIFALVIEDDPDAAFIYTQALRDNGYEVEHIAHGEEAARKLKNLAPDIILLDLHLPAVSGVTLLQQIRSSKHLEKTPVVLVTADNRTADSIEDAAEMVLLKPATYTQVKELIKRILIKSLKNKVI